MPLALHLERIRLTRAHPALINMIVGLNKLKRLAIEDMEPLECVPGECWKSLTSLESLRIWNCPRLTSLSKAPPPLGTRHQSNLVDLDSSDSEELDLPNYNESSGGNNIHLILELHSLRSVTLRRLPKLASLPRWLLQLSNLEDLSIVDCEELDLCKDESGNNNNNLILDSHGGLHHSLHSVYLYGLPKLASLPQWLLQLSNLEQLGIFSCSNLKELPEQIEALQSLQMLQIWSCPSLTSLPEGIRRLGSLTHLITFECPELERRCKRDGGRGPGQDRSYPPHTTSLLKRLESLLNLNVTPYTDPIVANHIWIGGSGIDMGSKSSGSTKRDQAWELKREIIYGVRDTFSRDLPTVLAQSLWVVTLRSKEK
ncbi:hypothetical protein NL676_029829, partial [Syzygium grande]